MPVRHPKPTSTGHVTWLRECSRMASEVGHRTRVSRVTFEEAVETLRGLTGRQITVNLSDDRFGASDGYIADFAGKLVRVDDPIEGVDAPVHYFRIGNDSGFGIHREMFKSAEWTTESGLRNLRIAVGDVVLRVASADQG